MKVQVSAMGAINEDADPATLTVARPRPGADAPRDPGRSHQTPDALATDPYTVRHDQLGVDARRSHTHAG
jgi:hypothetical protein